MDNIDFSKEKLHKMINNKIYCDEDVVDNDCRACNDKGENNDLVLLHNLFSF